MTIKIITIILLIIILLIYFFLSANNGIVHDRGLKAYYLSFLPKKYVIAYKLITLDNYKNIINKLNYPMIFKPNECSGSGMNVEKIDNIQQALVYLKKNKFGGIVAQKYSPLKNEYSILYEKHPFLNKGCVIAIIEKKPVAKTNKFLPLSTMSTDKKKRRSLVVDHSDNITKNFSDRIDAITKNIPNLYAGRYDVKAKNLKELLNGNFGIMELNNLFGIDLRAYTKTVNRFDKDNYKIQLRWFFKRVLLGIENNIIGNPFRILYSIKNQFNTMCESEYKAVKRSVVKYHIQKN